VSYLAEYYTSRIMIICYPVLTKMWAFGL